MPYIGFTEGKPMVRRALMSEDRARIKVLEIDPAVGLSAEMPDEVLKEAIHLCQTSL